jgi:hypothetical protein
MFYARQQDTEDFYKRHVRFMRPNLVSRQFPLGEAADGGHISTCRLLPKKGALPNARVIAGRGEVLVRSAARGQLQQNTVTWSLPSMLLTDGCDTHHQPTNQAPSDVMSDYRAMRCPEDIRYFVVLRAVVSGHHDIAYWLVEKLGVDVSRGPKLV